MKNIFKTLILFSLFLLLLSFQNSCTVTKPVIPQNYVLVPGGSFNMGDSSKAGLKDNGDNDETPEHLVVVKSFWISKYELTQKEWIDIMEDNPSINKGSKLPAEKISWYDSVEYCNKRSKKEGLKPYYKINKKKDPNNSNEYDDVKWIVTINKDGNGYRLPTEEEWEYAARYIDRKTWTPGNNFSGAVKSYEDAEENDKVAWYSANSDMSTHEVGTKNPNKLGIYDMSGNVWEWCWSTFSRYPGNKDKDESFYNKNFHVLRGGAWDYDDKFCRVSNRTAHGSNLRSGHYGLRLVRDVLK